MADTDTAFAPLPDDAEQAILDGARKDRADRWSPDEGIANADNAHSTNTAKEMVDAIQDKGHDFLEGDIRLDAAGVPVMAHDRGDDQGMSLAQWLEIATTSGKGMKLELKEAAAVDAVIAAARKHSGHAERMMFNVSVGDDGVSEQQIRQINDAFPDSMLAFSGGAGDLSEEDIANLVRAAEIVGDPERVSFPVENRGMDEQTVRALEPYGQVSVWNAPQISPFYNQGDIASDHERFREMGAQGMIDLRQGQLAMDMPEFKAPEFTGAIGTDKPKLSDLPTSADERSGRPSMDTQDGIMPSLSSLNPGVPDMPDLPDIDMPDVKMPRFGL